MASARSRVFSTDSVTRQHTGSPSDRVPIYTRKVQLRTTDGQITFSDIATFVEAMEIVQAPDGTPIDVEMLGGQPSSMMAEWTYRPDTEKK